MIIYSLGVRTSESARPSLQGDLRPEAEKGHDKQRQEEEELKPRLRQADVSVAEVAKDLASPFV